MNNDESLTNSGKPPTAQSKKEETKSNEDETVSDLTSSNNSSVPILLKPKPAKDRQLSWSDQLGNSLTAPVQAQNSPPAPFSPPPLHPPTPTSIQPVYDTLSELPVTSSMSKPLLPKPKAANRQLSWSDHFGKDLATQNQPRDTTPPSSPPLSSVKEESTVSDLASNKLMLPKPKPANRQLSWSDQVGKDLATQSNQHQNSPPTSLPVPNRIPPPTFSPPRPPVPMTTNKTNRPAFSNTDVEKWMAMVADSTNSVAYSPLTTGSMEENEFAGAPAPESLAMPQLLPPSKNLQPMLVTLQDVTGPSSMESEAENAILVAVERRLAKQQQQQQRARTKSFDNVSRSGSTILRHVPDTDVFLSDDDDDDDEKGDGALAGKDIPDHISVAEGVSVNSKATSSTTNVSKPDVINKPQKSTATQSNPLSRPAIINKPQMSTATNSNHISRPAMMTKPQKSTATNANLARPAMISKPQMSTASHANKHRHTKTMDNTLFDLTQAMNAMHQEGRDGDDNYMSSDSDNENEKEHPPIATNPVFDATANVVYCGKTTAELVAAKVSAQKNWDALKQTVQTVTTLKASGRTHSKDDEDHDMHSEEATTPSVNANTPMVEMEEGKVKIAVNPEVEKTPSARQNGSRRQSQWNKMRRRRRSLQAQVRQGLISDARAFTRQRWSVFRSYLYAVALWIAPAITIAAILFYWADNPPTGRINSGTKLIFDFETNTTVLINEDGEEFAANQASASWWILFLCVRHVITFSLARMLQVVIIDFFCVSNRTFVNIFGQMFTLFVIQSRGWPFLMFTWASLDFGLLQGDSEFVNHWGYWQSYLTLFTYHNPSGGIPDEPLYRRMLILMMVVGLVVAIKRVWLGFLLGKKIYRNYSEDLAKLMKKLLLLGKVAFVARDVARRASYHNAQLVKSLSINKYGFSEEQYYGLLRSSSEDDLVKHSSDETVHEDLNEFSGQLIDSDDPLQLTQAERNRIDEYLGAWEEPEKEMGIADNVSIDSILQFRQSLSFLDNRFLFSIAWGDTSTRESTIMASQNVFHKLNITSTDSSTLRFDIMTLAAVDEDGEINTKELKELIRLVRPDRDGNLTLLEFVKVRAIFENGYLDVLSTLFQHFNQIQKSVDVVYKEARLLRAAVQNSEKVDRAFENVINIAFYFILGFAVLSQLGVNPTALFVAMSTNIVAFAFIIGPAMSKMFEGWLFILLQRPYDIGDRIHVSNVQQDTNADGNPSWIVKVRSD